MPAPTFRRAIFLCLAFATSAAGRATASEYYYAMIFGSQSSPKQLRYTHTWATFVKAEGEGTNANRYVLTVQTISWLPKTLDVKVWSRQPEEGVNLSLEDTLQAMYANRENVTMWGPFVVRKEVYDRALRVIDIMNSGRAQYRAISTAQDLLISDCIHAVAAVDPVFGRDHYPLIRIGKPASRFMARQVMMWSVFDQAAYDNAWLIPRLGLCRYPIHIVPPRAIPKRGCFLCLFPD
jgi:hypothetical protein